MSTFDLTLSDRIFIEASPEAAWTVFSDLGRWPEWNAVCRKVDRLAGEPWTVGFSFRMVLRMAGLPVPFRPVVVELEVPHRVVWSSTRFTVTGRRTFLFQPSERGSIVVDEKRFTSPVLPVRFFYPRFAIRAMSRTWLRSLKEETERLREGEPAPSATS